MSMQAAIEAFRQYLTSEKRASEHTVRAYLHDVEELAAFARAARGLGAATIRRRSTSLTSSCAAPTLRRSMERTTP